MFNGVLAEEKDFMDVLKALAALRDKARSDRDRHEQDEDNCICVNDENNPHCQECY
jgi:molybdopterin converting factor small subunit